MRISVRVKPGAKKAFVGGCYDAPSGKELSVAVTARAVEGKANQAVVDSLAKALGCKRKDITLVSGATHRSKVFDVPDVCAPTVADLIAATN